MTEQLEYDRLQLEVKKRKDIRPWLTGGTHDAPLPTAEELAPQCALRRPKPADLYVDKISDDFRQPELPKFLKSLHSIVKKAKKREKARGTRLAYIEAPPFDPFKVCWAENMPGRASSTTVPEEMSTEGCFNTSEPVLGFVDIGNEDTIFVRYVYDMWRKKVVRAVDVGYTLSYPCDEMTMVYYGLDDGMLYLNMDGPTLRGICSHETAVPFKSFKKVVKDLEESKRVWW